MNLQQYIQASDETCRVINKRVWEVDIAILPKLERIANHAFDQLRAFITRDKI